MTCDIQKALEHELNIYKETKDINQYIKYLHYFLIKNAENEEICTDIITDSLSFEELTLLGITKDDHSFILDLVDKRRNDYFSSKKEFNDLCVYFSFLSSIDLDMFDIDSLCGFSRRMHKDFTDHEWSFMRQ